MTHETIADPKERRAGRQVVLVEMVRAVDNVAKTLEAHVQIRHDNRLRVKEEYTSGDRSFSYLHRIFVFAVVVSAAVATVHGVQHVDSEEKINECFSVRNDERRHVQCPRQ